MQGYLYYTASEVQEMLGVSRGKAYQVVRGLNEELEAKGFIVIDGKIPKKFFDEHFYGLSAQSPQTASAQLV